MWVYRGEELQKRLLLTSAAGFWLDYWLFLHSDETHSIWCARPFGLQQLAILAREATGRHDRVLRDQLAAELGAASRIAHVVSFLELPPSVEPLEDSRWNQEWLDWLEHVAEVAVPSAVVGELEYALAASLVDGDVWTATFLTRRIAAELAEEEWSKHLLLQNAITAVLNNERLYGDVFDAEAFAVALHNSLSPSEPRVFTVTIPVTSVSLGKRQRSGRPDDPEQPTFIFSDAPAEWPDVIAIRYHIYATHAEEAAARGRERAHAFIDAQRTRRYATAHLVGNVTVETITSETPTLVPLPRPFSSTRPMVRKFPALLPERVRSGEQVSAQRQRRRQAARWHISQALADWAEDAHSAASHMWQALESFAGPGDGGRRAAERIADEYVQQAPRELAVHLAGCIGAQRAVFWSAARPRPSVCNWFTWPRTNMAVTQWLAGVFSGKRNYSNWRPTAPRVLFDERVGLLRLVHDTLVAERPPQWMRQRLASDFGLLYAVRNRVVHRGERLLGSPAVRYLARAAMEVLVRLAEQHTAQVVPADGQAG